MDKTLLEIGCDGGSIRITSKNICGMFFYGVLSHETFHTDSLTLTFLSLHHAWSYLKQRYPKWYQLYLVQINTQMTELVKKDYILTKDKNEYTIDSWLEQLTGKGIGF